MYDDDDYDGEYDCPKRHEFISWCKQQGVNPDDLDDEELEGYRDEYIYELEARDGEMDLLLSSYRL